MELGAGRAVPELYMASWYRQKSSGLGVREELGLNLAFDTHEYGTLDEGPHRS